MKTLLFGTDTSILSEWVTNYSLQEYEEVYELADLQEKLKECGECVVIADYDTAAPQINKLLTGNTLPQKMIVLEKTPELLIGKNLILHGTKAYGNARMQPLHFEQMINTVQNNQVWTYPELTAFLSKINTPLSDEAHNLLQHRLSEKEIAVVYAILEGLTNEAIAHKIGATVRTVKAHISSIFQKLHINDRVSLVLLLK